MSPDTVNDVLHPAVVEPVLDNFRETTTDLGRLQLFQFGCPGAGFDFDYIPPHGHTSKNCAGDADIGEEAHVASLTGQYPPTDRDKSLSSSLDASSSSDSSWLAGHFESSNGTSHYGSSGSDKQDLSMSDRDEAMGADETNTVEEDIQLTTTDQWMYATPDEAGLSGPLATVGQLGQAASEPVGWTYREVLEIIAFPPSEAPHLWYSNVSKLAAQIGMPVGSTGRDIVAFIMHVAAAKNELDRVSELVRSMAGTAKAVERQAVVSSMLASTIPNAPLAVPLEGNASPVVETDSRQARKRVHDEISSVSEPGDREELESSSSSSSTDDDNMKAMLSRPARRSKYSEEDLYCRIDDCLWAFNDPRTCMKHRQRHFPVQWPCPGPCKKTEKEGKFARDETLKRHLLFPRYAACKKVVLNLLDLESIPSSGALWLAPLRDGPDRPWESPDFQLTDLKTVKERKMNVRDSTKAPSPAEKTCRRRYK
ncbi:hypothetical protein BJY52DRAFT_704761 [Lactarius psammicola]|nr:hypothetical protein BJY52DRAFT_704761 [Lactarius psammicola]